MTQKKCIVLFLFTTFMLATSYTIAEVANQVTIPGLQQPPQSTGSQTTIQTPMLPDQFPVYVQGTVVVNQPVPGFNKVLIPTKNNFTGTPGCYIVCYSRNQNGAIYPVNKKFYVMGMIRVQGDYVGRGCQPANLSNQKLSADTDYKNMCNSNFPACSNGCWAGGDTGGWYGIQR